MSEDDDFFKNYKPKDVYIGVPTEYDTYRPIGITDIIYQAFDIDLRKLKKYNYFFTFF